MLIEELVSKETSPAAPTTMDENGIHVLFPLWESVPLDITLIYEGDVIMIDDWEGPLSVGIIEGCEPEIGRLLWLLEATRGRTIRALSGIETAVLDWAPPTNSNSIGTLLYHIVDIEMDWLYVEVLETTNRPQEVVDLLAWDTRDESGRLTAVSGLSLAEHLHRLDRTRAYLLDTFRKMSLADFRRLRQLEHYAVTPEWTLHHLIQHEAEHRGQIGEIRLLAQL